VETLRSMSDISDHYVKQNNALDIYETYFSNKKDKDSKKGAKGRSAAAPGGKKTSNIDEVQSVVKLCTESSAATVLTVFKDVEQKQRRSVSSLSWHPTDGKKLAVSYCAPQYEQVENMNMNSYIWDVHNPNKPELALIPMSPLTCIEYNPKETPLLIGGAHNGTLFVFDTRRGSHSVDYSHMENSHNDPVYSVSWIQSKLNNEVVSISIDGKMLFWDIRNLGKPFEEYNLEITAANKGYTGLMGGMALNYDTSYSTSKFLVGTEQGIACIFNRKSKKQDKVEKTYFGHHGPIYAVQRNLFFNKYFLSVGDWTARIYSEELKTPVMETRYDSTYLTSGCWSPSRPAVFFTTKQNGELDVWDYLYNQDRPLVSVKLSDYALNTIKVFDGRYLACGAADGSVHYLELSSDLSNYVDGERQPVDSEKRILEAMLERELQRERTLEADRIKREKDRKRDEAQEQEKLKKQEANTQHEQEEKMRREEELNKLTDEYWETVQAEVDTSVVSATEETTD